MTSGDIQIPSATPEELATAVIESIEAGARVLIKVLILIVLLVTHWVLALIEVKLV